MIHSLLDITHWSQAVLGEVLAPGDLAVDLTVGNGNDTLFLWNAVGPEGCVIGFDIQSQAIEKTYEFLSAHRIPVKVHQGGSWPGLPGRGVHLLLENHAGWAERVPGKPRAVIANLGFLPGGDPERVTRKGSTVAALAAAMENLCRGGRLAGVCYPGHPGGREEAAAVKALFAAADRARFRSLRMENFLSEESPFLLVLERR